MINKNILDAFNEQIKHEIGSAYLYYQMAAYFYAQNYPGMAHWMDIQKDEELLHAQRFFNHITSRGGMPIIMGFDVPKHDWKSPLEAFKDAYNHELFITSKIHDLVKLANKESDFPAVEFLQWFVREQVEEEDNTSKIASTLERIGSSNDGLILLDKELSARPAATPIAAADAADAAAAENDAEIVHCSGNIRDSRQYRKERRGFLPQGSYACGRSFRIQSVP